MNTVQLDPASIPGVTLIELLEDTRVLIEQHRGILVYGESEILISTSFGNVAVIGSSLILRHISKEKLVITGTVIELKLQRQR
jgi:sporulation protein YqfC